eukprot:8954097-Heterocapsa_arctica.AAC.1
MEAVASQLASNFQFGSNGKGHRGETFQGKGRVPNTSGPFRKQLESPDDWQCPFGLVVWARKNHCPKCQEPRVEGDWVEGPKKGQEVKEQEAPAGGQVQAPQQDVGTEGESEGGDEDGSHQEANAAQVHRQDSGNLAGRREGQRDLQVPAARSRGAEIVANLRSTHGHAAAQRERG